MADELQSSSALAEGESRRWRWLTPRLAGAWVWVEVVALTLLALVLGGFARPEDPFYIGTQFPWPWFAPVLIALRYGVMPGVVAAALLLACWFGWVPADSRAEFPKLYFLGGLLLVMVCGEYSGQWRTRLRRLTELNLYLEDRVERVTKRYYLLRLSHERLEQDMLAKPTTLRDALAQLRQRVANAAEPRQILPGAQAVLEFLAQACQLEAAAIYTPLPERGYTCVATIGDPPALAPDDALLAHARTHATLAHVRAADDPTQLRASDHLVIAPLVAADKRWLGVLAVSRMPFIALNEENLQSLAVLSSAYADGVAAADQVLPLIARHPGLPLDFAEELIKLQRIQREFALPSHIVVLEFGAHASRGDIYAQVKRQLRTPDVIWSIDEAGGRSVIVNLMPLATQAAVDGYLLRTETSLREVFGGDLHDLGVRATVISLAGPSPLASVARIIARAGT